MSVRSIITLFTLLGLSLLGPRPVLTQSPDAPLTLVTTGGRQQLPTVTLDGRRMVALDTLAPAFGLTLGNNRQPGRVTMSRNDAVMVLTADDEIVSVDGRLVSLPSAPVQRDDTWYVPIEFIGRAVGLVHDQNVELRRRSSLVVIGDIRVPQVIARVQRSGADTRLRLTISPATEHTVQRNADQLIVTFLANALDPVIEGIPGGVLITRVERDPDNPRLIVGLATTVGAYTAETQPGLVGSNELVINLQPRPTPLARTVPPPIPPPIVETETETDASPDLPAVSELTPPRQIRAIAIDPGHGGEDTGSEGPEGSLEKDVTLSVARRLQSAIENQLGLDVVLTRTNDTAVSLDARAAIANNNRADLFISLHANASARATAAGAEVFYLSLAEYGEEASETVGVGGQSVPVAGGGTRVLDVVPWDIAQLRFVDESALLAQTVTQELAGRVPMSPRGLQQAPFRVLVGANMPAVLVEMGFLSNPEQETQLTSPSFQRAIVSGLLRSIIRFRDEIASAPRPLTESGNPGGTDLPENGTSRTLQ